MQKKLPLLCLFALLVALVAFYFPFLTGQSSFFFEDTSDAFEPLCRFIGQSLARMHLPAWDPYNYCGMSELAVLHPDILYPPNWLFAILPFNEGLSVNLVLSQVVCAVGMYLLVVELGWGELCGLIAACMISCCGYMFSFVNNYTLLATACWLPLCLLLVKRFTRTEGKGLLRASIALACCSALMLTGGRPEISGPGLACIVGYAWYCRAPLLVPVLRAVFVGVLLSMPALLPSLEWAPLGRRSEGLAPEEVLQYSANWYHLLCLYVSPPLGDLQVNAQRLRFLVEPKNFPPYFGSPFISSAGVLLFLMGLRKPGKLLYWVTLTVLVVGLIVSCSASIPPARMLVEHVAALSALRFPSKLLFFPLFFMSLFAARGVRNFLDGKTKASALIVLPVVAAGTALYLLLAHGAVLPYVVTPNAIPLQAARLAQREIGVGLINWSIVAVACLMLLWFGVKNGRRSASVWAVGCVLFGSLMLNAFSNCHAQAPGNFFSVPSYCAEQVRRLGGGKDPGTQFRTTSLALEGVTTPPDYTPTAPRARVVDRYQYERQLLKTYGNMDSGIAMTWGWDGPTNGEYVNFFLNLYVDSSQSLAHLGQSVESADAAMYRFLQTTATRFVITQMWRDTVAGGNVVMHQPVTQLPASFFQMRLEDPRMNVRIYELAEPLPRAYVSRCWKVVSRDQLLSQITDAQKSQFNPAVCSLLEDEPGFSATAPAGSPISAASLAEHEPEEIEVDADVKQPSLLVLCDQYYPGWVAYVDGKQVPILRCNGFMRAVAIAQPGRHVVRFFYHPVSLMGGVALAAVAVVWLLVWGVRAMKPEA